MVLAVVVVEVCRVVDVVVDVVVEEEVDVKSVSTLTTAKQPTSTIINNPAINNN